MKNNYDLTEKLSEKNSIKILILLIIGAVFTRLYFTPFHIPISLDGIDYLILSNDLIINKKFIK